MMDSSITLIGRDPARFDPVALDQLEATARLDGMGRVVGLPDLHAGSGIAVGAAFWSPDRIWPHLVGSDIGCGMALWETGLPVRKFRVGTVERKLHGLDGPWDGDVSSELVGAGLPADLASPALGTIGGATTSSNSSASRTSSMPIALRPSAWRTTASG